MHSCTITYGQLTISWDNHGTVTIARTDYPQSVQLSLSEWVLVLKCAELGGWPVAAPTKPVSDLT